MYISKTGIWFLKSSPNVGAIQTEIMNTLGSQMPSWESLRTLNLRQNAAVKPTGFELLLRPRNWKETLKAETAREILLHKTEHSAGSNTGRPVDSRAVSTWLKTKSKYKYKFQWQGSTFFLCVTKLSHSSPDLNWF